MLEEVLAIAFWVAVLVLVLWLVNWMIFILAAVQRISRQMASLIQLTAEVLHQLSPPPTSDESGGGDDNTSPPTTPAM